MTTFMDSAWYFLRFCDPATTSTRSSTPRWSQAWMPVDYYVGGKEHAVGHLLYSRFITQVLAKHGLLDLARSGSRRRPRLASMSPSAACSTRASSTRTARR